MPKWSRERWAALAGAIVLTIGLPIAIDQGYFRYNIYALPLLGLAAALLYSGLIVTSAHCVRLIRWSQEAFGGHYPWLIFCGILAFYCALVLATGFGFKVALRYSRQHVAELIARDAKASEQQLLPQATSKAPTPVGNVATNEHSSPPSPPMSSAVRPDRRNNEAAGKAAAGTTSCISPATFTSQRRQINDGVQGYYVTEVSIVKHGVVEPNTSFKMYFDAGIREIRAGKGMRPMALSYASGGTDAGAMAQEKYGDGDVLAFEVTSNAPLMVKCIDRLAPPAPPRHFKVGIPQSLRAMPSADTKPAGQPQASETQHVVSDTNAVVVQLATFIDEGASIQRRFIESNDARKELEEANEWATRVDKYLAATLDVTYSIQFRNAHGSAWMGMPVNRSMEGGGYWQTIEGKKSCLNDFVGELRRSKPQ